MAKLGLLASSGQLFPILLILVIGSFWSIAAISHQEDRKITPINSNVYYLQDYCEDIVQENIRQPRDTDHDHDHDHDHRFGIHYIQNYYMNKTAKLVKSEIKFQKKMLKNQIKLQKKYEKMRRKFGKKLSKKIKQIHLDPIVQPSIVIRSWREQSPFKGRLHQHRRPSIINKTISSRTNRICQILLKLPANIAPVNNNSLPHHTKLTHFGTVVNFLELNSSSPKLPTESNNKDEKHLRNRINNNIRIITSDPNMTQYWFKGERLVLDQADESNQTTANENLAQDNSESSIASFDTSNQTQQTDKQEKSLTNIDIIDEGIMLEPILQQINGDNSETNESIPTEHLESTSSSDNVTNNEEIKWLLIQLDSTDIDSENETDNSQEMDNKDIPNEYDSTDDDELDHQQQVELIVNLYQAIKQIYGNDSSNGAISESEINPSSGEKTLSKPNKLDAETMSCPAGTFDCASDGTQCIPNSLRCNGEDNCGNRQDELLNCGTINLYYIFGGNNKGYGENGENKSDYFDLTSYGFWFAIQILLILFCAAGMMYCLSLCCRMCDRRRTGKHDYNQLIETHPWHRSIYVNKSGSRMFSNGANSETQWLSSSWSRQFRPSVPEPNTNYYTPRQNTQDPPPQYNQPPPYGYNNGHFLGNQSDNQRSVVNEHIYVNNNYGQPLGSTTVATTIKPPPNGIYGAQYSNAQDYPQQNIGEAYPNYGGVNQGGEKC